MSPIFGASQPTLLPQNLHWCLPNYIGISKPKLLPPILHWCTCASKPLLLPPNLDWYLQYLYWCLPTDTDALQCILVHWHLPTYIGVSTYTGALVPSCLHWCSICHLSKIKFTAWMLSMKTAVGCLTYIIPVAMDLLIKEKIGIYSPSSMSMYTNFS